MNYLTTLYKEARRHHRAGQNKDAASLYLCVVDCELAHAGALEILGVPAHSTGLADVTLGWAIKAQKSDPKNVSLLVKISVACHKFG